MLFCKISTITLILKILKNQQFTTSSCFCDFTVSANIIRNLGNTNPSTRVWSDKRIYPLIIIVNSLIDWRQRYPSRHKQGICSFLKTMFLILMEIHRRFYFEGEWVYFFLAPVVSSTTLLQTVIWSITMTWEPETASKNLLLHSITDFYNEHIFDIYCIKLLLLLRYYLFYQKCDKNERECTVKI